MEEMGSTRVDIPSYSLTIPNHLIKEILQSELPLKLVVEIPVQKETTVNPKGEMVTHLSPSQMETEFSWSLPARFATAVSEQWTPDTTSPPSRGPMTPPPPSEEPVDLRSSSTAEEPPDEEGRRSPSLLNGN